MRIRSLAHSRSPRGERGLKYIERIARENFFTSRSPRGERGLKSYYEQRPKPGQRRSPRGERGLKSASAAVRKESRLVAPLAGSVD